MAHWQATTTTYQKCKNDIKNRSYVFRSVTYDTLYGASSSSPLFGNAATNQDVIDAISGRNTQRPEHSYHEIGLAGAHSAALSQSLLSGDIPIFKLIGEFLNEGKDRVKYAFVILESTG